jgi:predicted PurR-regulated permease PerM
VIAVTVWPVHRRFTGILPEHARRTLAPLAFTLLTALALLGPLGFAAYEVERIGEIALAWIGLAQQHGLPAPDWVAQLPLVGAHAAEWWNKNLGNPDAAREFASRLDTATLADWTRIFGAQLAQRAVTFFVTVLALFFILRDGAYLGDRLHALARGWLGQHGKHLLDRMEAAVRGTVVGTVIVAVGEGALITVGYFVAVVPAPLLFGAFTVAFAMLPFGAWLAFGVASLILLGKGATVAALALFAYGAGVMLAGDNFVQPVLVGGRVRLPFLWALVGIFGGLQAFGLLGLFLGPVVMALLLTIWREWIDPAIDEQQAAPG